MNMYSKGTCPSTVTHHTTDLQFNIGLRRGNRNDDEYVPTVVLYLLGSKTGYFLFKGAMIPFPVISSVACQNTPPRASCMDFDLSARAM